MIIDIHPENPDLRKIREAARVIRNGGVIIYPTDTIYAIGCDAFNKKALERVAKIKDINLKKANFSFVCNDLKHLSEYTKNIGTSEFKILKKNTPGPYTFILPANNSIPKLLKNNKKTVGIRIPDNNIARELVKELESPIISTSVHSDDKILEYITDPSLIYENYYTHIDLLINGGYGNNIASTVVDLCSGDPEIIRQGAGDLLY
jgi:tRNA threonylcarbamoyl adenosine modification protein (Sua5/YciO/YrdC/YwlC family)